MTTTVCLFVIAVVSFVLGFCGFLKLTFKLTFKKQIPGITLLIQTHNECSSDSETKDVGPKSSFGFVFYSFDQCVFTQRKLDKGAVSLLLLHIGLQVSLALLLDIHILSRRGVSQGGRGRREGGEYVRYNCCKWGIQFQWCHPVQTLPSQRCTLCRAAAFALLFLPTVKKKKKNKCVYFMLLKLREWTLGNR